MKLHILSDYVLVRVVEQEKISSGGIHIPDTAANENCIRGEVLGVGPGRVVDGKVLQVKVNIGDRVIFMKMGFTTVSVDGEILLIIPASSILAVVV